MFGVKGARSFGVGGAPITGGNRFGVGDAPRGVGNAGGPPGEALGGTGFDEDRVKGVCGIVGGGKNGGGLTGVTGEGGTTAAGAVT